MNVGVFLTYGMSLKKWHEIGILDRELEVYNKLSKKVSYTIFSYGINDYSYIKNKNIKIFHLSKYFFFKNKYLKFINSLLIPFFIKNKIKNFHILKSNQTLGAWLPAICSVLYNKKFIHRAGYDLYQNSSDCLNRGVLSLFFLKYFIIALFKLSDQIILTNNSHKKNLKKNNINSKIFILPNFINTKKFYPLKIEKKNERILFVGRIEEEKNLNLIILSLKNTNFGLDIIGSGKKKFIKKLKILAHKEGVSVKFYGTIRNNLISKYYNNYKYFINFSNYEGNPKAVLEAMACGCLVICSKVRGNKELILNNYNGILVNKNILSLNKKIKELNKIKRKKIVRNSLKYIQDNFSLEKITKLELEIYDSLYTR